MITRKLTGAPPVPAFPRGATDTQMHLYLPGFPALPGGPGLPEDPLPDAGAYAQVMHWLGLDRVIVTQGNAHQHDNTNLLASLEALGDCAWGVAVVTKDTTKAQLAALADRRIVGARIMDLPGGAVDLTQLEVVDAIAHDMGWMIAVQFDGSHILDHLPRLQWLRSRWVFDHHGKFFGGVAADGPETDAVLRLIDRGNCWFKFAGAYESSAQPWPYADVAGPSRRIAAHAPDRIVWGTNWPHNGARTTADYPDDAALAALSLGWLPEGTREAVLVRNPVDLYRLPPLPSV
ncbi:amidohydrolase family protein [Neotabrizicola sp. VNH66]|uniref:amidohydrolase family protein n=1 Tax=Neotabrizicola sp. VNH66 TaxID=3400918 RepID=UPI003C058FD3